jgi:hypothetical protein
MAIHDRAVDNDNDRVTLWADVHSDVAHFGPWRSLKLTLVALRFIDPGSVPIPFQVVGFSVWCWVNLSEQKWVNSGERYRP